MQRYLATKHQHLKKASEQLLANRPSEFRQSLNLVISNSSIGGTGNNLPPYQHPPKPITTTVIPSIGKKHALKKYDQFTLNTSCFWGSTGSNTYYPSCAISRNFCYKNNE